MSSETINTNETVVNDPSNLTMMKSNELTETSNGNGFVHSNGNNQIDQTQAEEVESSKNNYDENEQQTYQKNDLEPEAFRKVFIGGLSYKTEDQAFRDYFSLYGDIVVS